MALRRHSAAERRLRTYPALLEPSSLTQRGCSLLSATPTAHGQTARTSLLSVKAPLPSFPD